MRRNGTLTPKPVNNPDAHDRFLKVRKEIQELDTEGKLTPEDFENLPPELLIKHPLQNVWTLWFFNYCSTKSWEENLCAITSFHTVEDFWALYNYIELASKLQHGCDYSLFKQGIKPMWEDVRNRRGGRWVLKLQRPQRNADLDNYWLETLLCVIGESFDDNDEICGAVVNIRTKMDKIAVWTKDCSKPDVVMNIGLKLKETLNLSPKMTIGFESHQDAIKSGPAVKNKFTV